MTKSKNTDTAPNPPTVLKVKTTADFLATLPVMMGFTVADSIVVALFERGKARSAIRCDIPAASQGFADSQIDKSLIKLIKKSVAITEVALVFYTSERFDRSGQAPRRSLAVWLESRLEDAGIEVIENACVAADGWSNYYDPRGAALGYPLTAIDSSIAGLEARMLVDDPVQNLAELGVQNNADPKQKVAFSEELTKLTLNSRSRESCGTADAFAKTISFCERICKGAAPAQRLDECAEFVIAIQKPVHLLMAILTVSTGAAGIRRIVASMDEAVFENLATSESFPEFLRQIAVERVKPDALRHVCDSLATILALAPDEYAAAIASLAAWAWWIGGMATPATVNIDHALALDPPTKTASLIEQLINSGPPSWIFNEQITNYR